MVDDQPRTTTMFDIDIAWKERFTDDDQSWRQERVNYVVIDPCACVSDITAVISVSIKS